MLSVDPSAATQVGQTCSRSHASTLFSGAQPSSVGLGEKEAFRHYLDCMHHQVAHVRQATFDDAVSQYLVQLDGAEAQLQSMQSKGVLSQGCD